MTSRVKPWAAVPPLLFFPLLASAQAVLEPVVVTATRQEAKASDLLSDVTVIDRKEIERSAGQTIAELLMRQPGIQGASTGGPGTATSLYVRGANSNQTKILVDGIPINSMSNSGSPLQYLSLADVDRIEIVRGPASTLYGADALGGVIQIFTRKGQQGAKVDGFVGYGTRNTFEANAGISVGGEQWRLRVSGNRQSSDSISARKHAGGHDEDRDGYENSGGAVSLAVTPAQGHEIGFSFRQNEGRALYDGGYASSYGSVDGLLDDYLKFRTSQWQLYSRNRLASFWRSTLSYGQAVDRQVNYSEGAVAYGVRDISLMKTENRQLSWQNDIDLPLGSLLVAAERLAQQAWESTTLNGRDDMANNAVLLGWNASWGKHSWQINGRRDNHSAFGGKSTYSLAYGYQITPQWRVRASYGTSFRAPSLDDLYNPSWGNPDLKPEQGRNREVGIVWEEGAHTASATYYNNRVKDLITYTANPVTWEGGYENVDRARLEGVTLAYRGRFGDWGVRAAYDWLNAKNETTGQRLGRRARHSGSVEVSRHWGALETGVAWRGVGRRFDTNTETGKMGGYSLVDLTARYAINKNWSIEGRINNVFDKNYELAQAYGTLGTSAFVGVRYVPD